MAKTVIGIDIDASSIKVIEIEPGKELAVKAFGVSNLEFKETPSPEELLRAQTEALSEAIASLPPRKKFDNVVSLVSGREVRTRILSFPPMPRKEIAGVVEPAAATCMRVAGAPRAPWGVRPPSRGSDLSASPAA